jgi:hypothetical protein
MKQGAYSIQQYLKIFCRPCFPTPSSQILNILSQEAIAKIEIYRIDGKKEGMVNPKIHNTIASVDISMLSTGDYFCKVYTDKGITFSKFSKD